MFEIVRVHQEREFFIIHKWWRGLGDQWNSRLWLLWKSSKTYIKEPWNQEKSLVKGFITFFASFILSFKESTCKRRKNVFLFYFESSFLSWDYQILLFQIFKCHDVIKYPSMKHETHLLNNLGSKHSLVVKFG